MPDAEAQPRKGKVQFWQLLSFVVSPIGVLKIIEVTLLVTCMVLFLAGQECQDWPVHEVLYGLPLGISAGSTLISLVITARIASSGRNPITVPTWAKAEVLFDVAAVVLLVFAEAVTVFDFVCVNHVETIVALALSLVTILLYVCSGALAWLLYIRHQELLRSLEQRRRASRAAVVAANSKLRAPSVVSASALGTVEAPAPKTVESRAPSIVQSRAPSIVQALPLTN